jgi:hypothetical protein
MSPAGTEWTLLAGCPSVGHAEPLLAALGKAGLGGEIRGRHLPTVQATPVGVWVQARNAGRANEVLRELEARRDQATIRCATCGEESPENFETCWACGAVLPVDRR